MCIICTCTGQPELVLFMFVCVWERESCCRVVLPVNVRRLSSVLTAKKSVVNQGSSSAKEVINKHVIFIWCVLVCVCLAMYVCAPTPLDLFCSQTAWGWVRESWRHDSNGVECVKGQERWINTNKKLPLICNHSVEVAALEKIRAPSLCSLMKG